MVIASLDAKFANWDRKISPLNYLPDAHRIKYQSDKTFILAAFLDMLRKIELEDTAFRPEIIIQHEMHTRWTLQGLPFRV
jgi:hypothetical protein